jgi:hypothetical protein
MYFMFIKVTDVRYKEDVVLALQSEGIVRASYIESRDLQKSLSDDFKLFTGFFTGGAEESQIIITALAESPGQADEVLANLRQAGIDVDSEPVLRIVMWPVTDVFDGPAGWLRRGGENRSDAGPDRSPGG